MKKKKNTHFTHTHIFFLGRLPPLPIQDCPRSPGFGEGWAVSPEAAQGSGSPRDRGWRPDQGTSRRLPGTLEGLRGPRTRAQSPRPSTEVGAPFRSGNGADLCAGGSDPLSLEDAGHPEVLLRVGSPRPNGGRTQPRPWQAACADRQPRAHPLGERTRGRPSGAGSKGRPPGGALRGRCRPRQPGLVNMQGAWSSEKSRFSPRVHLHVDVGRCCPD